MARRLDYATLMHRAMRGLIREALTEVAEQGLPGTHHFFITFGTLHPDVEIADWLSDRYPEEMTIVMQNWFEGLEVGEEGFSVTLNFGDAPEPLYIPYEAIRTFVDPSVEFGLRFEAPDELPEEAGGAEASPPPPAVLPGAHAAEGSNEAAEDPRREERGEAEVVSLDKFRK